MLGTGNAFMPYGRYHSFALIDGKHIIDCPPTAMASLRRARVPLSDIETVFITHIHGDHVFGFPFLLLERRYISDRAMLKPLTVVAADGVREHLWKLCEMAYPGSLEEIFSTITWISEVEGELDSGMSWRRFRVQHDESVDPYGTISIRVKKEVLFTAAIQALVKRYMMKSVQRAWPSLRWDILNGLIPIIITNLQTFNRWPRRLNLSVSSSHIPSLTNPAFILKLPLRTNIQFIRKTSIMQKMDFVFTEVEKIGSLESRNTTREFVRTKVRKTTVICVIFLRKSV